MGTRRRHPGLLLAALLTCVAVESAGAQGDLPPRQFRTTVWTIENGLPQGTVNAIAQSPDGQLWLATFGGLLRFDGIEFHQFAFEGPEAPSLSRVTALRPAQDGSVLVGTQSGSIVRVRGGGHETVARSRPGFDAVSGLLELSDGSLWVTEPDGLLRVLRDGEWQVIAEPQHEGGYNRVALREAGSGVAVIGTRMFVLATDGSPPGVVPLSQPATSVGIGKDGRLWVGGRGALFREGPQGLEAVRTEPQLPHEVSCILDLGVDGVWIGTPSGPIHLREDPATGVWRVNAQIPGIPPRFAVRSLFADAERNIWVGSNGNGLARVTPYRVPMRIPGQECFALVPDGEGGAFAASFRQGVIHLFADGREIAIDLPAPPVGPHQVQALLFDSKDRLWAAQGESLIRRSEGRWSLLDPGTGTPLRVAYFCEAVDGTIWAASVEGRVIAIGEDDRVRLRHDLRRRITGLAPSRGPGAWVGGEGRLAHVDEVVREATGRGTEAPPGEVRDLYEDQDGRSWIATYGGGLATLDSGVVRRIPATAALPDMSLTRILEDGSGRLWILANRGVIVVPKSDLVASMTNREPAGAVLIGPEAGMPEASAAAPAGFLDSDGTFWFATLTGVARIDPGSFPFNRIPPIPRVDRILADGVPFPLATDVSLPPGTQRLTVDFGSSALRAPERVLYKYRLLGFDDEWVDARSTRSASFTAMGPGAFRLEVMARNEDGVWCERPAEVRIEILPRWWQTGLFKGVALVGILAGLFFLDRLRLRILERRARTLFDALEGKARAEARESRLREEIAHVGRVATAGELATTLAHEVNQPLAAIVTSAQAGRRIIADPRADQAAIPEILEDIVQQGQRASEVIRRLRSFLRKNPTERGPVLLDDLVRDTMPFVRRDLEDHDVRFTLRLEAGAASIEADRLQLQQVLVNLVRNATEAMAGRPGPRTLEITTAVRGDQAEIGVTDSGPGLAPAVAARLFEPYVTTKPQGMGLGLPICRSIVEAHGGKIAARNVPGGGASFTVLLPTAQGRVPTGSAARG